MSLNIRFVRGTGWDSKLIEWQTRCWCSHVEFITPDLHATFGAQLRGGVRWREASDSCYYKDVTDWEVWTFQTTKEQDSDINNFIQMTSGDRYDWKAILSFGLGERDWRTSHAYICSEWVMRLLEYTKTTVHLPARLPVSRITPRDVYMVYTMRIGVNQDAQDRLMAVPQRQLVPTQQFHSRR